MILDSQMALSTAQSIVSGVGDVVSTNVYDTGASADVGIGEDLKIEVRTGTAAAGAGSSIQIVLQTDDNVGFASPKEFPLTAALVFGQFTANKVMAQERLPYGMERFFRLVYRISGASVSAGTITSVIAKDLQAAPPAPTTVPGVK